MTSQTAAHRLVMAAKSGKRLSSWATHPRPHEPDDQPQEDPRQQGSQHHNGHKQDQPAHHTAFHQRLALVRHVLPAGEKAHRLQRKGELASGGMHRCRYAEKNARSPTRDTRWRIVATSQQKTCRNKRDWAHESFSPSVA